MTQAKTLDQLITQVTAALERDGRVNLHRWPITAYIHNEQLILEGKVENIVAKKVAFAVARRLAGQWPVADKLRVVATEPREDRELRDAVVNNLSQELALRECNLRVSTQTGFDAIRDVPGDAGGVIEVAIDDGVITLSGRVGSLSHYRLVEVLAWWTRGCAAINNRLSVVPPEEDNDGELSDAVRAVLEKDPLVHAGQLVASVDDGVVTLQGYVATDAEKKFAVLDTWYLPGVRDVVDHIAVGS